MKYWLQSIIFLCLLVIASCQEDDKKQDDINELMGRFDSIVVAQEKGPSLEYLYENILNYAENGIIVIAEQIRSNAVSELFWSLMKEKEFNKYQISHKYYHPKFISDNIFVSIVSKKTYDFC